MNLIILNQETKKRKRELIKKYQSFFARGLMGAIEFDDYINRKVFEYASK